MAKSKITGEEERYSHIDLLDFQANVEGSEQAFANLQPGLAKIDPTLTGTIATALRRARSLLDKYRRQRPAVGLRALHDADRADVTALAAGRAGRRGAAVPVASKVVNAE